MKDCYIRIIPNERYGATGNDIERVGRVVRNPVKRKAHPRWAKQEKAGPSRPPRMV